LLNKKQYKQKPKSQIKMRKLILPMMLSVTLLIIGGILVTSCKKEGPMGPAGPSGPTGANGATGATGATGSNGSDGLNGQDANAWCKTCHNTANWSAVIAQFNSSLHSSGGSWVGEGNRRDCAACHSKQGFLECLVTGLDTTTYNHMVGTTSYTSYGQGLPLTCDVCHTFHGTLDSVDFPNYAQRTVDPIALRVNKNIVFDFGASNLCATCHQARDIKSSMSPTYALDTINWAGNDSVLITSSRYGGHNGPQAHIFGGVGAGCFEVPGLTSYTNSPHMDQLSCGDCHVLSTASGTAHGGHTFLMSDGTTDNLSQCIKCHTGATDFDVNGKVTEIKALMLTIENKMLTYGWLKNEGANAYGGVSTGTICKGGASVSSSNKLKVTEQQAAAIFDFKVVMIDGSFGVHNYKYTKALLSNINAIL
jgi:hypothetical protein